MKILVTGAAGNSNQVLVPMLLNAGHTVIALDVVAMPYDCECVRTSVLDDHALVKYARGADLVVHAAGTADHAHPRTPQVPDAYYGWWEMSAESTHHLYRSALYADVAKIIFLSSQEYYSYAHGPGVIDEEYPASRPAKNYYDLCKVISEDIARYYAARHGIRSIVLRPGNFTGLPEPGPDFLGNRLRREDVAQMEFRCLDYEPEDGFEAFNVMAGNPFQPEDLPDLMERPMELIERYYPGAKALMAANNSVWEGTNRLRTIRKAERKLGYRPEFTFERYLEKLGWTRR
ncbi:MAG: NAD(P)-dependent oxidoreductase [Chloroflexi bacterium]|nr:NAD(P)-dependent oxidoreductase [Chloroflexota bacterium]